MILVAGSTGLVGGQICLNLAEAGKPVRALVRSTSDRAKVDALMLSLARGDTIDVTDCQTLFPSIAAGLTSLRDYAKRSTRA